MDNVCHCEERSDAPQGGFSCPFGAIHLLAIRIPCNAQHCPSPEGTERERIAPQAFPSVTTGLRPRNDSRWGSWSDLAVVRRSSGRILRTPREGRPYGGGRKDIVGTPLPGCPGMHCRSKELVRFSLYRTAAFGGWNAGLRPVARAASNRRRRLLASVDGVPYGFNVPYNDPTHNETTCNAPITVCQRRLAARKSPPGREGFGCWIRGYYSASTSSTSSTASTASTSSVMPSIWLNRSM